MSAKWNDGAAESAIRASRLDIDENTAAWNDMIALELGSLHACPVLHGSPP